MGLVAVVFLARVRARNCAAPAYGARLLGYRLKPPQQSIAPIESMTPRAPRRSGRRVVPPAAQWGGHVTATLAGGRGTRCDDLLAKGNASPASMARHRKTKV